MIGTVVYCLCTLTSTLCAVALLLQYRRNPIRLLFWSSVCFVGLSLNNFLLALDYFTGPKTDLSVPRTIPAFLGLLVMIWAFVEETL